ncbi:MAG: CrcB family protein [Micrococcales bacterium]|nr:CrcB family protein [Micrococcales bacterium]
MIAVFLAGGVGATCRWLLGILLSRIRRGLDLFVINLSGAFLLGLLFAWQSAQTGTGLVWTEGAAFLGGYTTFSTALVQSADLVKASGWRLAAAHAGAMCLAAVAAAALGLWLGG